MNDIYQWAIKWGVPLAAIHDLKMSIGMMPELSESNLSLTGGETKSSILCRQDASNFDSILWRNNVGAYQDETGRLIRYGLCNDTKALNKKVKSSDLIGIRKVLIVPSMVGTYMGQFVAREIKKPDWTYTGTGREPAQLKFLTIVKMWHGDAAFSIGKFN